MIGPWIKKNNDGNQFDLTKFHLVEKNMAIEITTDGLYSISVQVKISAINSFNLMYCNYFAITYKNSRIFSS